MVYKYGMYKKRFPRLFRKIRRTARSNLKRRSFTKKRYSKSIKRNYKRKLNKSKGFNLTKNVARYYIDW